MKEIFYELISEAMNGKVIIDGEDWNIGFNTIIYRNNSEEMYINERNITTLVIKDEERFFKLLEEYVLLEMEFDRKYYKIYTDIIRNKMKAIITYLFVNANTEEFLNPLDLLRRKISFLKDDVFEYLSDGKIITFEDFLFNSNLKLKRYTHGIVMETPYRIDISLSKSIDNETIECPLANIAYGISKENNEKVCYVYSIMKTKEKKNIKSEEQLYQKKINRALFKLNEGIMKQETEEYKDYKKGESDYYPENISDVTQSFVLALSTFVALLQKEGISKIRIIPYLPIRYLSRDIGASNVNDGAKKEELILRNNRIQENATDKFLRTFMRVQYHMGEDLELIGLPYEQDEYMTFKLREKSRELNNPILDEVSNMILGMKKGKII